MNLEYLKNMKTPTGENQARYLSKGALSYYIIKDFDFDFGRRRKGRGDNSLLFDWLPGSVALLMGVA